MMNLVKRLRNHHHNETLNKADLEKLCKEAAERIEELERHYNKSLKDIEHLKKQALAVKRKNVTLKNQTLRVAQDARRAMLTRTQ